MACFSRKKCPNLKIWIKKAIPAFFDFSLRTGSGRNDKCDAFAQSPVRLAPTRFLCIIVCPALSSVILAVRTFCNKKRRPAFRLVFSSAGARTRTWSSMKTGRAYMTIIMSWLVLSPTRPVDTGRLWLTAAPVSREYKRKETQLSPSLFFCGCQDSNLEPFGS